MVSPLWEINVVDARTQLRFMFSVAGEMLNLNLDKSAAADEALCQEKGLSA